MQVLSNCMESTITELMGDFSESIVISIEHSSDGSGIGVALLAASHLQYLEVDKSEKCNPSPGAFF
ncbi:hypothetical protein LguiB_018418 [Lonicera macranthoides]